MCTVDAKKEMREQNQGVSSKHKGKEHKEIVEKYTSHSGWLETVRSE